MRIPTFILSKRFSLVDYLYFSTLFGVFSGALTYHLGVDILFFYFIMLSNLILMTFVIKVELIPVWLISLILYLAASGVWGIVRGTDSLSQFAKQFVGINMSALYFFYFFQLPGNTIYRAFRSYCRLSYWSCLVGFLPWIVSVIIHGGTFIRFQGISTEPAAFCTLILPAYYWSASSFLFARKNAKEFLAFTIAIIISGSSLGFISVAFGAILLLARKKLLLLTSPLVLAVLVGGIYLTSANFRLRLNDTSSAITSDDLQGVNLSTYAVITNLFVTERVFEESPIFGNGLGSHPISYERHIGTIEGATESGGGEWLGYNDTDAASMTLRSISEQGLVGFLGIIAFLWYFHVNESSIFGVVSNALLVTFFLKMIRGGLYFPPEQFFFIFIYFMNYRVYRDKNRASASHAISTSSDFLGAV